MAEVMHWKNNSMILPVDKYILELTKQLTGLLVGRGKKVKFRGIFRDKFAEETADFTRISQEFSRPISLKELKLCYTYDTKETRYV